MIPLSLLMDLSMQRNCNEQAGGRAVHNSGRSPARRRTVMTALAYAALLVAALVIGWVSASLFAKALSLANVLPGGGFLA